MKVKGMDNIYEFLDEHHIDYQKFNHPAVFTCEEAERLCPDMPGQPVKNLFLRDDKGRRHFLVVIGKDKSVDLGKLKDSLGTSKLGFASTERLQKYLGVIPGAVTLLGIINDPDGNVEVVIDEKTWGKSLQCHPLVNTATLVIPHKGIEQFLEATKHEAKIIEVPER